MRKHFAVVIPLLCLAMSCASGTMSSGPMTSGNMGAMPGMMSASDIAGIVATANEGEIMEGNAAVSKATSADVRSFAQMMVTDHTNALNTVREVFARNNIMPGDNDITRQLKQGAQQTVSNLSTYRSSSFDRVYMQSQVDTHQWLLTQLDDVLIPSSRGELRTTLQTQRGAVAMHLDHARQILSGL